jgi:MORN repeat
LTGAIYKGEWREDRPSGNGILFSLPNEIIEGRFDGYRVMDGQVKILMSNGEFYEGNLKNNMRHSTGIHYYLNGDQYDGEWDQDKRVSKGRIFLVDGGKMTGVFVQDKLEGYLEYEDKSGNYF